ncbi:hypothetical protein GCM10010327_62170 [Streptomyces nitrosporeus]|nr:hypothetical protein GCM10010327_62170 [Streptomyces nitrosporeus]
MTCGVLDALEADIVSGATGGENAAGILETAGTGATAYATSVLVTLLPASTECRHGERASFPARTVESHAWAVRAVFPKGCARCRECRAEATQERN